MVPRVRAWLLSLGLLLAAPAVAQPRLTPEYQTGGEMPLGFYGVGLDFQPVRWLSVAGGVGLSNFQGSSQVQLALAPRLRWDVLPWLALDAGAAFSRGEREKDDSGRLAMGHRLGPELGLELAPLPRARLRLLGGFAFGLGAGQKNGAYGGVAVGWSVLGPQRANLAPPGAWYGWQTLLVDAGAATLLILDRPGHDGSGTGLRYAAGQQAPVVFVAGGPLVHLTHRHLVRAGGSLLLRAGLVALTFLITHGNDRNECVNYGCRSRKAMVFAAGAASVADAVWLGWDR
jgi:hypothetical protein